MSEADVRAIFALRKAQTFDPRLTHAKARFRFEIEGVGVWRVIVDHGTVVVAEGPGDADCIVSVHDPEDFVHIARGEQNLITAHMQGRVEVDGDLALAQLLHSLTPQPKQKRDAEATP